MSAVVANIQDLHKYKAKYYYHVIVQLKITLTLNTPQLPYVWSRWYCCNKSCSDLFDLYKLNRDVFIKLYYHGNIQWYSYFAYMRKDFFCGGGVNSFYIRGRFNFFQRGEFFCDSEPNFPDPPSPPVLNGCSLSLQSDMILTLCITSNSILKFYL